MFELLQAFGIIQQEFGIMPVQSPAEIARDGPDRLAMLSYLTRLQDQLQQETPVITGTVTHAHPEGPGFGHDCSEIKEAFCQIKECQHCSVLFTLIHILCSAGRKMAW